MRLTEIYSKWVILKKQQVKPTTLATYQTLWKAHIRPKWGGKSAEEICGKWARSWLYGLIDSGLSVKTVHEICLCLRQILKFAISELDMKVPSLNWHIRWPRPVHHLGPVKTFTKEDMGKVLAACQKQMTQQKLALILTFCTGLRIGEICGLRWGDVDFERHTIHVRRTVSRIYNAGMTATFLHIGTTKTESGMRDIPVVENLWPILESFGQSTSAETYLVSGTLKPAEPHSFRRWYKDFIREAGVSEVLRFHAVRHTFATTLIEGGADVKSVSALMGHSNVALTMNLYVHPSEYTKSEAVNRIITPLFPATTLQSPDTP